MLQQDKPDDYVIATNETHTVKEFVENSFKYVDINLYWQGEGVAETGVCTRTSKVVVKVNPKFFRPAEVDLLLGNPAKAEIALGWKRNINFEKLVERMISNYFNRLSGVGK